MISGIYWECRELFLGAQTPQHELFIRRNIALAMSAVPGMGWSWDGVPFTKFDKLLVPNRI